MTRTIRALAVSLLLALTSWSAALTAQAAPAEPSAAAFRLAGEETPAIAAHAPAADTPHALAPVAAKTKGDQALAADQAAAPVVDLGAEARTLRPGQRAHADAKDGTFQLAQLTLLGAGRPTAGEAGDPAVVRPAFRIDGIWYGTGDSTTFGVGAVTNADWPYLVNAAKTAGSGSFTNAGQSGQTTTYIAAYINGGPKISGPTITATERARPWILGGGLNDGSASVGGSTKNWPAQVKTNVLAMASYLTGGVEWGYFVAPAQDQTAAGMIQGSDFIFLTRDMQATIGRRALDAWRWLMDNATLTPGGANHFNVTQNASIPLTYRGQSDSGSAVAFTENDALPFLSAGTPGTLNYDDGQIVYDTVDANYRRKLGAYGTGKWSAASTDRLDGKHFALYGNTALKTMFGDFIMATEGNGAPFASPWEAKVAQDVAAGTVFDVPYSGTATVAAITAASNPSGHWSVALTTPTINGETQNVAQFSRTATGTLTEGETILTLRLTNANGTLYSKVRVFVGKPSTQTTPRMLTIASPGIAATSRSHTPMTDGKAFSFAFWINPASLSSNLGLLTATGNFGDNNIMNIVIGTNGSVTWTIRGVGGVSKFCRSASSLVTAGSRQWILGSANLSGTPVCKFYKNEGTVSTGTTTLIDENVLASKMDYMFLAQSAPRQFGSGANNQIDPTTPFVGEFGLGILFPGIVDWEASSNAARRQLFSDTAPYAPVARTPKSSVGGISVGLELGGGGLGDFFWGSSANDNDIIVPSHVARTRVTASP